MKVFLIDGNSFCYRAHFAVKNLSTKTGRPTGAVFGFVNMLNKIIKLQKPDLLGVAFDLKAPTFRHEKFADYKSGRPPMPQDLIQQLPLIKEVISAYRIPIFEKKGFEAEDLIATIASKLEKFGYEIFIVSADKDMLQLINDNIKVYNDQKQDSIYTEKEVRQRFAAAPDKIVDIMALMGDKVDNIPGVPGIGEAAAVELIKEFGSLENIYENADKIKQVKRRQLLLDNKEKAFLSKELAAINSRVEIEFDPEELKLKTPDSQKLINLFKELEFKSLLKNFLRPDTQSSQYKLVEKENDFSDLLREIKKHSFICFAFETTSSAPMTAKIIGIAFCLEEKKAFYVPVKLKQPHSFEENIFSSSNNYGLNENFVMENLKPLFEDKGRQKIGQDIKHKKIILKNYGISLNGPFFDTMVAAYLLNPSKLNHSLEDIAFEYLNYSMASLDDLLGKGRDRLNILEAKPEDLKNYACEDADITFRLKSILESKLKEENLFELFRGIEMPLVETLAWMELSGVCLDVPFLKNMSLGMQEALIKLTEKIYGAAGEEFNVNSTRQLQHILFEKLKLKSVKRTKTGPSTDVEVLSKLAKEHPLAEMLLEYRELSKLKSTYADALPKMINPATGRLHTSFNQTVAQTGRLSSSNPNLQNIPVKTEMGRKIRKAFRTEDENHVILTADYSQIELRILAHFSKDEALREAFDKDMDIHAHTASLIFGMLEKDITEKMRALAKTVNFGIIYGMSPYGLAKELDIETEKAQEFIEAYFNRYSRVKEYIDSQIEFAGEHGYISTLFNRKRYIPQINSDNVQLRNFAIRTVINTPIQGTASDIIKKAMNEIYEKFTAENLKSRLVLQVHDELVFEVLKSEIKIAADIAEKYMCRAAGDLIVPVKVSIKIGRNWLETEEYSS